MYRKIWKNIKFDDFLHLALNSTFFLIKKNKQHQLPNGY
jgi:hypothetical protein